MWFHRRGSLNPWTSLQGFLRTYDPPQGNLKPCLKRDRPLLTGAHGCLEGHRLLCVWGGCCPCPYHALWQDKHWACFLFFAGASVLGKVSLPLQTKQACLEGVRGAGLPGGQRVSLLLLLTVQVWALPASRHSETNCSVLSPVCRLVRATLGQAEALWPSCREVLQMMVSWKQALVAARSSGWPHSSWRWRSHHTSTSSNPEASVSYSDRWVLEEGWGVSKIYAYLQSGLKVLDDTV